MSELFKFLELVLSQIQSIPSKNGFEHQSDWVTPYFAMAILGIPAARGGVLGMPQAGDICAAGNGPKSGS